MGWSGEEEERRDEHLQALPRPLKDVTVGEDEGGLYMLVSFFFLFPASIPDALPSPRITITPFPSSHPRVGTGRPVLFLLSDVDVAEPVETGRPFPTLPHTHPQFSRK